MKPLADGVKLPLGLVGLGAIGSGLALNLLEHGWPLIVHDRDAARVEALRRSAPRAPRALVPDVAASVADLLASLPRPRRVFVVVPAGDAVDAVLAAMLPQLTSGDVVVDLGNSHPDETARRQAEVAARGAAWLGCGLSGGAAGARQGPCLMAGGSGSAWDAVAAPLLAVAARGPEGVGAALVGDGAAGHLVKTIHNGIEYAWLAALGEVHELLTCSGHGASEQAELLREWADVGGLDGMLIRLTARVLDTTDTEGVPLVDAVLDRLEQKGTGAWTVELALTHGVAVPQIAAAVSGRLLSCRAAGVVDPGGPTADRERTRAALAIEPAELAVTLRAALDGALAEGLQLLAAADRDVDLGLDPAAILRLWRFGSLLASERLEPAASAWDLTAGRDTVGRVPEEWRRVVSAAVSAGQPVPVLAAGLARAEALAGGRREGAALIAALRDAFGRHGVTARRNPDGPPHHADWTGGPDRLVS